MRKYFKYSINDTVAIKKILAIDLFNYEADYTYPEENHDFWEFSHVENGEICYEIEGVKSLSLKKGDSFILSPGTKHTLKTGSHPAKLFFICFECKSPIINALSEFKKPAEDYDKNFLPFLTEEALHTFKTSSFKKLTPLENPRLGGEQCVQAYLELFIINILRAQAEKSNPTIFFKNRDNPLAVSDRVYELLRRRVYDKITIDGICREVNYSRSYISHIFKEYYGKSVISAFNELKTEEAKKLLTRSDLTISAISDMLNFSDFHMFNYTFKKHAGMSPSAYRASLYGRPENGD